MFFFRNCKTPKSIPTTARIFLGTYTAISGVWVTYKALARALASRTLVAQGASPLCSLMPRKVAQAIQRPIVVAELVRAHSDSNPEEPAGCNGPSSLQVLQTPASKRRKTSSKVTAASPASCTSPPASTIIQEADHHATPPVGKKAKKSAAALFSPSPGAGSRDDPLLDLGSLVAGILVKRPSATCKTPYVADVRLADDSLTMAHAPAMDCAGMIMPGATVHMTANAPKTDGSTTKTTHAIQVVSDLRPDDAIASVGSHPMLAERIAAAALERRLLEPLLGSYERMEGQKTFGNTRVDYVLHHADGSRTLLEIKNVVCADYPEGGVPAGRPKLGVYTAPAQGYIPTAIFPHGAVKAGIKVVSDRAIKHMHELTQLQAAGLDAIGPLRCAVLFVVNRSDCKAFRPCHEADMLFADVVKRAEMQGVKVLAHDVRWEDGRCYWGKQLPVCYGCGVSGVVDDARLQEVLDFNANDPRKNWKSKKAVAEREKGSAVKAKKAAAVKEEEQEGDEVVKSGKARRGKAAAGPAPAAATRKPAAHRKKVISESETETSAGTVICK